MSRRVTRRLMLAGGMAASAAAVMPAIAAPKWDAADWIRRWNRLGCGLTVGGNALSLKGRLNGDRAAIGAMLIEIAPADRQTAVIDLWERELAWTQPAEDAALVAVRRLEQVDREFVSEANDPAGNAAWLDRRDAEVRKLRWTPASTKKGIVAKIRHGIDIQSDLGDEIVKTTLAQLERMS
ncbi:hypothetical protein EWE75_04210 [Sphingomonas populi]|uniref:Uncharacterized protein n=1 Tax=Sphingomonas populi TaxID=2484750 RepID=A0A4Q6Y637_9SPHN|nr:hypothetical protein [Sphingomonas populi]RZF65862.1 hypothetical protein EWE75_04210 [Sphingomonas populi]